jgi:CubicO group peptidase (beta-lactamase class C family)
LLQRSRWLSALLASVALLACSDGDDAARAPIDYSATISATRARVHEQLDAGLANAASVALIDRGEVVWAEAFGTIDELGTPVTNETLFGFGSVSKVVAAAATLKLVEEGLVELDAPLLQYVPEFSMRSPEFAQITVRMLLDHSSGLPGSDFLNCFTTGAYPEYEDQVLATLAELHLKHTPGEMSVYCNDGFTLVQLLVRAVDGRSYAQFVVEELFAPLGMSQSEFPLAPSAEGTFAAFVAQGESAPQEYANPHASGGLRSNPTEFAQFLAAMMQEGCVDGTRILEAASVAEMGTDQSVDEPLRVIESVDAYGLGWDGVRHPDFHASGVRVWHKNGGTIHYSAQVLAAPDHELGVIVVGSSSGFPAMTLAAAFLFDALVDRGVLSALPSPVSVPPRTLAAPDPAAAAARAGVFASHNALYRIQAQPDASLDTEVWQDGAWFPYLQDLTLRSDGSWQSDAAPEVRVDVVDDSGASYMVANFPTSSGFALESWPFAQRLAPRVAALSPAWSTRAARTWLVTNERADSLFGGLGPATLALQPLADLPGYLLVQCMPLGITDLPVDARASDSLARMCLRLPKVLGRDLSEIEPFVRDGEEWLRCGGLRARPLDTVPPLATGTLTIAPDGFGEWRSVPALATFTLHGPLVARPFDAQFERLPEGALGPAYLLFQGSPGESMTIVVNP